MEQQFVQCIDKTGTIVQKSLYFLLGKELCNCDQNLVLKLKTRIYLRADAMTRYLLSPDIRPG